MTIALDATPLTVSTGGVARYTLELARALARRFPNDDHWLLSDQKFDMPPDAPHNLRRGDPPRNRVEKKWWLWGLQQEMMRRRIDLFHGTDFSVPYLPSRPSVMTVHDLSPWLDRRWQPHAGRIRRRTALLLRTGLATMVITPSEAVRRAAIDRFKLSPDRVVAVPLAASAHFRPVVSHAPSPYFLFVGTLEPRKNLPGLIEAWREVRSTHAVDLVIAGRQRTDFPPIAAEPGLHLRGAVDEAELPALYSGALAVVYPSLYEGFGLPVLEAMQCGAIVVTSKDPAILELTGGAAIHVEAADTHALAEALRAIAAVPENFAGVKQRALDRAREFSWDRTAERTREVYDAAVRVFRK
ncbi:MAG: glycosyltransferase family 4 protein [Acidobacteriia bacterium]|nr:glycosyltransferase family 4 protein [Terriglobia bacterium]